MEVCVVPVTDIMVPVFPAGTERPYGGTPARFMSYNLTQHVARTCIALGWLTWTQENPRRKKNIRNAVLFGYTAAVHSAPYYNYC